MNSSQSDNATSLLQRLFPAQLPPVVALIAWLLILSAAVNAPQYSLRLLGGTPVWPGYNLTLQIYISAIILAIAKCLCGIALLRSIWWSRRATVVVLAISLLYRVATYIGFDRLLYIGYPVHLTFPSTLDSALLIVLGMGSDIVMIYCLTLPHIAAAWPRQPDIPPLTEQKFPALHTALLRCSRAVGHLFPPVLPAEVAYLALVMLISASYAVVCDVSWFFRMPHNARSDPRFLLSLLLVPYPFETSIKTRFSKLLAVVSKG